MKKIGILVHLDEKHELIEHLQRLGVMEISDLVRGESLEKHYAQIEHEVEEFRQYALGCDFLLSFLAPFSEEKKPGMFASKPAVSYEDLKDVAASFPTKTIVSRCQEIAQRLNEIKGEKSSLSERIASLAPFSDIPVPPSELRNHKASQSFIGTIPAASLPAVQSALSSMKHAHLSVLNEGPQGVSIWAIAYGDSLELDRRLKDAEFKSFHLPDCDHLLSEELVRLDATIVALDEESAALLSEAKTFALDLPKIRLLHDFYSNKAKAHQIRHSFWYTKNVAALCGWITEEKLALLKVQLKKHLDAYHLFDLDPRPGEHVPTVLKNSKVLAPFEAVTNMYGLPQYGEVDPSPLLAIFFLVFFGTCLTDAGYGVVLVLVSLFALKFLPLDQGMKKLVKLIGFGGVFTTIIGALVGGWFGIDVATLPDFARETVSALTLLNPLEDPLTFLLLCFGAGLLHILFGRGVKMIWHFKNGRFIDGLLDEGFWILFILIVLVYGITPNLVEAGVFSENVAKFVTKLALAWTILIVLTSGRKAKGIVGKLGVGVVSLYGLVGVLSDTLSYSRLLALGLATGIIASVVNTIATLFSELVPVVGPVLMILVLIFGHIFNLAINLLGAYIHTSRLQFVEFFPKFLEGGGRDFKPFSRKDVHSDVTF